jgi:hypothetical protein
MPQESSANIFQFSNIDQKLLHFKKRFGRIVLLMTLIFTYHLALADEIPKIFPIPKDVEYFEGEFNLNEETKILIPENASDNDWFLARLLVAEIADLYLLPVNIIKSDTLSFDKNFILMGSISNDLVNRYCLRNQMKEELKSLGDEGYILKIIQNGVVVASNSEAGSLYGLESLRQLITKRTDKIVIPNVKVVDYPQLPFRGIRLYIPGRENITFFKRFIRDFMALYKFNKIILEVNGAMRFDRHPEINIGSIEFANEMNYSRRGRPEGPGNQYQNSSHHDAADGQILEKEEVADLVNYIRKFHIEVIPEIPSLMHSYYLLNRHRELAEIKNAEWPDTYCPSNPDSYKLLFEVLDEYVEVIQPQMIHLGKDEWRMPFDVCPLCKGKDYRELFIQDIRKIYDYLEGKGIKVAMWGDHLLESVRNKGFRDRETKSGYKYKIPGALTPEQVIQSIPKDILVFNWFWGDKKKDLALEKFGFKQVYGNFRPNISEWDQRSKWNSVLGGAPSSWVATTEFNFGKDLLYDFLGCGNLLWSADSLSDAKLITTTRQLMPEIRCYLNGEGLPSDDDNEIVSLDISSHYNITENKDILGIKLGHLNSGPVGKKQFILPTPELTKNKLAIAVGTGISTEGEFTNKVTKIKINQDVSSLIFLHACALPAGNEKGHRKIYNFMDTADLLGWYEVVYKDGFRTTIPIRYGVNILDIEAGKRASDTWPEGKTGAPQNFYAYQTEFLECSQIPNDSKAFFAYEWKNPRFGKIIKQISLYGIKSFRNTSDKQIPDNSLILLAINYTKKRAIPDVKYKSLEIKK